MFACTILLEKCFVHMSCSLNTLILQLLQVPLVRYVALFKDRSYKPLLVEHDTAHLARWNDISTTLYRCTEAQSLVFCLFTNLTRWK